jgi:hypothetical protein
MGTHLSFANVSSQFPERKTKTFIVVSQHDQSSLGRIEWDGGWRQYVFKPHSGCQWSWDCLWELSEYIKRLMEARKKK